MIHALVTASLLSFLPIADEPPQDGFETGNTILRVCTSKDEIDFGKCVGYVEGYSDSLALFRALNKLPPCLPKGVIAGQLKDVVVQYLERHPESRQMLAAGLVLMALSEAWCPLPKS